MAPIATFLLALGALLPSAYCRPAALSWHAWPNPPERDYPSEVLTIQQLQAAQPTLDGLPSNSNATLFAATLGVGHQNYTCNGTEFVQTVQGSGATALLYDITEILEHDPKLVNNAAQQCSNDQCPEYLESQLLGSHYFHFSLETDENTPIFNLSHAEPPAVLAGAKREDVPAPNSKNDVDWLFLTSGNDAITHGLAEVYRVDSHGGQPPNGLSCQRQGQQISVPYAAQYWFYT